MEGCCGSSRAATSSQYQPSYRVSTRPSPEEGEGKSRRAPSRDRMRSTAPCGFRDARRAFCMTRITTRYAASVIAHSSRIGPRNSARTPIPHQTGEEEEEEEEERVAEGAPRGSSTLPTHSYLPCHWKTLNHLVPVQSHHNSLVLVTIGCFLKSKKRLREVLVLSALDVGKLGRRIRRVFTSRAEILNLADQGAGSITAVRYVLRLFVCVCRLSFVGC